MAKKQTEMEGIECVMCIMLVSAKQMRVVCLYVYMHIHMNTVKVCIRVHAMYMFSQI